MKIIDKLKGRGIKPGLETVTELLRRLSDPQRDFKSAHIAGANGKGSTAAMLTEMLIRSGYKTALYTSPHLHRFNERVVVDRVEAPNDELEKIEHEVAEASEGLEPTYFEFTTAMAFLYFSRLQPDIAVVEVGLGGRLDATNLVDTAVSIITPLSIDHTEFLGNNIRSIAFEKSGVIKAGAPVVSAAQSPEALEVIKNAAKSAGSPLIIEGEHFSAAITQTKGAGPLSHIFSFHGRHKVLHNLECGLLGRHQVQNAAMALAAAQTLEEKGFTIPEKAKREGISEARWPGRMELVDSVPPILLDGAHNAGCAKILADELPEEFPGRQFHLLMGMQVTKDLGGFIETLAPILSSLHAVPIREMECYPPRKIADAARKAGIYARHYNSVTEGLASARHNAGVDGIALAAGSLYLVAQVIEIMDDE